MLKKLAVIGFAVGALVLGAPVAASASTSDYSTPPDVKIDDPGIDICESSTIAFGEGYFVAHEHVGVSVSGLHGADAGISGNTAAADGSLVVTFRPPSDGEGAYDVSFVGAERSYTATIIVAGGHDAASSCDHDPGVAAPVGMELPLTGGGNGLELALTGGGISPLVVGGGALALAAGGVLVVAGARRRHA